MSYKIILAGGVGPMAGVVLHQSIIEQTDNQGCDQGHIDVIHVSAASKINDRTKFLLGEVLDNPGIQMAELINPLIKAFPEDQLVIGVPCNTFHAAPIFDAFTKHLNISENVSVLHMIQSTIDYILQEMPSTTKVGLMSTTGTRNLKVYSDILEANSLQTIEVHPTHQQELHDTIYNPDFGIKAHSSPVTKKARENFEKYTNELISKGAQVIILGCTEIPLVMTEEFFNGVQLLDPMQVLAKQLINTSGYRVK